MTCSALRSVARHRLILVVLVAACGVPDDQPAVAATAPPAAPKVDPIAKGVPHGGAIMQVALTDKGDAALTFDNTGGVRLWPALDGSRTPVPLSVIAPEQLALANAGRDLLAAILDEAGSVRVMRLGRNGSVRADVQLPADIAIKQVVAIDQGVIVRREDQTVEWFSADGELRGRLVAEPASRIQTLAARRDQAVAIVTNGTSYEMRWLTTTHGKLAWDSKYELPTAVSGDLFALSPSKRRIAFIDAQQLLAVYDLGLVTTRVGNTAFGGGTMDIGFIDDDHVALMNDRLTWWSMPTKPAKDPWEVTSPPMPSPSTMMRSEGGAVADVGVVMGFGAALSITDTYAVRYLGYREHGVGNLGTAGDALWVGMSGTHYVWLDDQLVVKREIELRPNQSGPWIYATPVSDHHVITQAPFEGKYKVELVDVDKPDQPIAIGTFTSVDRLELANGILGISAASKIHRYKVDVATNAVTPLPALRVRGSLVSMRVFDPAKSGGITAVTVGWASDYDELYTLTIYRDNAKPQQIRKFKGRVIDIDEQANLFVVDGNEIQKRHGDTKLASFKLEHIGAPTAVTADGSRFGVLIDHDVVVVDSQGAEQWRKPLWGAQQLLFTKDGKHLAVRANGGLVLLDAKTGARTAMECGWSFSLMTTPPPTNALAAAPVCEDPML
jgi:hypothetical protein